VKDLECLFTSQILRFAQDDKSPDTIKFIIMLVSDILTLQAGERPRRQVLDSGLRFK
jgi:hypothetical protein